MPDFFIPRTVRDVVIRILRRNCSREHADTVDTAYRMDNAKSHHVIEIHLSILYVCVEKHQLDQYFVSSSKL